MHVFLLCLVALSACCVQPTQASWFKLADWLGPVPDKDLCSPQYNCSCPTPELLNDEDTVNCRDRAIMGLTVWSPISHLPLPTELMTFPGVYSTLDLSRNRIQAVKDKTFEENQQLRKLDLSSNSISTLFDNAFKSFPNLTDLILENNNIANIEPKAFHGLKKLENLDLSYNNLTFLPKCLLCPLTSLKELKLSFNPELKLSLKNSTFSHNGNLISLDLSNIAITTLHAETFNGTKLEKLVLGHNKISVVPTKALWHLRDTLKELDLSGNPIKSFGAYSFFKMNKLRTVMLSQMLKLETIDEYAFGDLTSLDTITIQYMPRIRKLHPKAFYYQKNGTEHVIPISDFTWSFSILSALPEKLLDWDKLRFLSLEYNHWECDCNLAWIKNSTVERLAGDHMVCSSPLELRGVHLKQIHKEHLTCNKRSSSTQYKNPTQIGLMLGLMLLGIGGSMTTVAILVYWRQGWLCRRPDTSAYNQIERTSDTITISEDMEWDNKDVA